MGIPEFWAWWEEFRPGAKELIEGEEFDTFLEALTEQVERIDPGLNGQVVELSDAGSGADYGLVISAGGDPALRALAERVVRHAPAQDGTWSYLPARPPTPEMLNEAVGFDDHELDLGHVSLGLRYDDRRLRFDVSVYHPDFAFIDEQTRIQVAVTAVTLALGEDDLLRWVGGVTPVESRPMDAVPASSLSAVVQDVAEEFPEPRWALFEGTGPTGKPLKAAALYPLRRVDYPLFDELISVRLRFKGDQPDDATDKSLKEVEGRVRESLDAEGVLVAQHTHDGERTLLIYADGEKDVQDRVAEAAGEAEVNAVPDPAWEAAAQFMM